MPLEHQILYLQIIIKLFEAKNNVEFLSNSVFIGDVCSDAFIKRGNILMGRKKSNLLHNKSSRKNRLKMFYQSNTTTNVRFLSTVNNVWSDFILLKHVKT